MVSGQCHYPHAWSPGSLTVRPHHVRKNILGKLSISMKMGKILENLYMRNGKSPHVLAPRKLFLEKG